MTVMTHLRPPAPPALPLDASIADALAHWAGVQPTQPALLDADASVSWRQLHARVEAVGHALGDFGLGAGHRVGLVVPEGLAGGLLALAVCCRCILVPLNPALTAAELADTAAQMHLDALVVPQALVQQVDAAKLSGLLALEASVIEGGTWILQRIGTEPVAARPASARLADVAVLLRSSGTTGVPKLVPVTHRNMLVMATKMASPQWFGLGPADRSVVNLPLYYAGGLKTLLLVPVLLGASVGFPRTGRGLQIGEWLPELQPTYFNTTPATLRGAMERAAAHVRGSSLRFIMCGASYLPDELRQAAEASFGLPVIEYYGLSEAGVMAANPLPPGEARPGSVGRALGDEVRIVDADRRPVPAGEVGEIQVRGASVCPGYLLPDGSLTDDAVDGTLLTGDLGRFDADGYLWILGRHKEVINRGGEKVFPYEVEKALLAHDDVLEAAVYGVPHPRLGQGVGGAVVLKAGARTTPRELSAFLADRLAPFKLPRRLRIVTELPRGKSGKVLRTALAEQHRRLAPASEPADSLLQEELLALWRRLLANDDVEVDDDFFDAGGDSLLATDLLLEIERMTGASTQGWDLSSLSVNDATRAVLRTLAEGPATGDLLTQVRPGTGAPLFFCHGDIASRGIYAHRLFEQLPSDHAVWLVNSPDRLAALGIEAAAAACLDDVLKVVRDSHSPHVYLAGWCNAGLVAWHLAHLLQGRGIRVLALYLIETPALNGDGGLRRVAQVLRSTGNWLPGRAGHFLRDEAMRGFWAIRRKGVPQFARAVARRASSADGALPAAAWVPQDLRQRARQYYQRIARYVPPPLDMPVTCFVAQDGTRSDTDPRRWNKLAPTVREILVPGSHYSSVIDHRATLAARLAECMRFSQTPRGTLDAATGA